MKAFDDVVGVLYRAATGEKPWAEALDAVAAYFGAQLAVLQRVDTREGRMLSHQLFQDFFAAYGCRHLAAAALLFPAPGEIVGFGLELPARGEGLGADERKELVSPGEHLAEALRLHERVRHAQLQALACAPLLHGFAEPMWLLEADRSVRFANAAADAECERARALVRRRPLLALTSRAADHRLTAQLHRLLTAGHGATAVLACRAAAATP